MKSMTDITATQPRRMVSLERLAAENRELRRLWLDLEDSYIKLRLKVERLESHYHDTSTKKSILK